MDSSLDYRIRNKIQITISDENGTPVQGTFRVCGIFRTTNAGFDQATVYVNSRELADLYDGKSILIHEIAVLIDDIGNADRVKERSVRNISVSTQSAPGKSWRLMHQ